MQRHWPTPCCVDKMDNSGNSSMGAGIPLPERIARLILEAFLSQRMRWPGQRIAEMEVPLTPALIADLTGIPGHEAESALCELVQAGTIRLLDSGLRVMDPDGLVDAAHVDPPALAAWLRK